MSNNSVIEVMLALIVEKERSNIKQEAKALYDEHIHALGVSANNCDGFYIQDMYFDMYGTLYTRQKDYPPLHPLLMSKGIKLRERVLRLTTDCVKIRQFFLSICAHLPNYDQIAITEYIPDYLLDQMRRTFPHLTISGESLERYLQNNPRAQKEYDKITRLIMYYLGAKLFS